MNPLRAWNAFWFRPTSARPLGFYRVLIGLVTLAHLGLLGFDLDYWLTDRGLLRGTEALELAGPLRPSPLQWWQGPNQVRAFLAATAAAAVAFTLGWRTRVAGVLLYLGMLSIVHRNLPSHSGSDSLLLINLFYLMLSPCGAAFSLDARRKARRRGAEAVALVAPWAQRLIQLQIAVVYFDTALLKANGSTWLGGTALHYVLNNGEFGRFPGLAVLCQSPLLINVLTLGALLIEFALPFLLWFRPTRPWAVLAGVALHAGVLVTINVPLFGELMCASYLLFFTPGEFEAGLRRVGLGRWRARGAGVGRGDGPEPWRGPRRGVAAGAGAVASV